MNRVKHGERKAYQAALADLPRYDIDMGIGRSLVGYTDGTRGVPVYEGPPPSPPPAPRAPIICNCTICRPLDPPASQP